MTTSGTSTSTSSSSSRPPQTADLFAGCSALTHVDFTECGTTLTDKMVQALGQHCPLLKSAVFVNCISIGAPSMKALGKGCTELETIDLSGKPSICV